MSQTIDHLCLIELKQFGIISLFSVNIQYIAMTLYNKIILQCQDIFYTES